jgi:hypothetical protein
MRSLAIMIAVVTARVRPSPTGFVVIRNSLGRAGASPRHLVDSAGAGPDSAASGVLPAIGEPEAEGVARLFNPGECRDTGRDADV